jgi:hypothetical protein
MSTSQCVSRAASFFKMELAIIWNNFCHSGICSVSIEVSNSEISQSVNWTDRQMDKQIDQQINKRASSLPLNLLFFLCHCISMSPL